MDGPTRYLARWELHGVRGTIVAIDVLRAFTTAAYALAGGATQIHVVGEVDEALDLARRHPGALTMGEENGLRPDGFDFSNSPVEISRADVEGRTLIQRTSAGTRGLVAATGAEHLFASSLVCATATARAVGRIGPSLPTYVITGRFPDAPGSGQDDLATAHFIDAVRTGQPPDQDGVREAVLSSEEARRTLDLGDRHAHADDLHYATDVDRFDFAMKVDRGCGGFRLLRDDA